MPSDTFLYTQMFNFTKYCIVSFLYLNHLHTERLYFYGWVYLLLFIYGKTDLVFTAIWNSPTGNGLQHLK